MVALTATLDSENNVAGGGVVVPRKVAGVFGRVADFGSSLLGAASDFSKSQDAEAQKAALNDTAQGVQDAMNAARNKLRAQAMFGTDETISTDFPADPGLASDTSFLKTGVVPMTIAPDVAAGSNRLGKIRSAVNQGTMPPEALDLHLENLIDTLYQKHPDNKAAIATYLKGQGYDHYLFRDVTNQMEQQQHVIDQAQAADDFYFDKGKAAGYAGPGYSRAETIAQGREAAINEFQLKIAKDKLDFANTQSQIDERERNANLKMAGNDLVKAMVGQADQTAGAVVRGFQGLTAKALADPTGQGFKDLQDAIPLLNNGIQTAKTSAIAQVYMHGGTKEQADAVADVYDRYGNSIKEVYTGELSRVHLNEQTIKDMQNTLGISAMKAFPLWSELSKLPGMANLLPTMFPTLPPEIAKKVSAEINGWAPGSTEGMYHVQRVAEILRGNLKLSQMTQEAAIKTIPTLIQAAEGNRKAVIQGDMSPSTATGFLNAQSNVDEAAFALAPGADVHSQRTASRLVAHQDTFTALEKLVKNPETHQDAIEVMRANRSTSAHGLELARKLPDTDAAGIAKVQYNAAKRLFEIVPDQAAYNRWAKGFSTANPTGIGSEFDYPVTNNAPTLQQYMSHVDSKLKDKVEIMNNHLNNLMRTTPYDDNIPKGATAQSLAAFYATGAPLTNASGKPVAETPVTQADFTSLVSQLRSQSVDLTTSTITDSNVENITSQAADQYGVPKALAHWLIGSEGSGRTKVDNNGDGKPDSSAYGYGQFIDETAKRYGLKGDGFDYRGDATKAVPAAMKYLSDLYRQYGSWEKAVEKYGTTARSNFKSDEAHQAKVDSLRRALGG